MPRRPGGGESPTNSIESGLRELVRDYGPDFRKLSRGEVEGLRMIMWTAQVPPDWPVDVKAVAVLSVIQELVEQIRNPRWRLAAQAAFRIPADQYFGPQCDSLAGRWRFLARSKGLPEHEVKKQADTYRGYWVAAAHQLAEMIEYRVYELNSSVNAWRTYRAGMPQPPNQLPISFDRTEVLYKFEGYRGIHYLSYRWLTARGNVDGYEATGWYFNQPDAPVEIIPLANCTLDGPLRDLPRGGRGAMLKFSHVLEAGESYFFAYIVRFNSNRPCRPAILYRAKGEEMRCLTIRTQFDPEALPVKCWHIDIEYDSEGWEEPPEGASELLQVSSIGYVDHMFDPCVPGRKYGLRWTWPSDV